MGKRVVDDASLTGVAESIRAKTGKVGALEFPEGFSAGVADVFAAGEQSEYDRFWDAFQQNGNRTNYTYVFSGTGWTHEQLEQIKYPITFPAETSAYQCWTKGMFYYLNNGGTSHIDMTNILSKMDFSNCQRMYYTFMNAYVKNINLDLSNCFCLAEVFNCADTGGKCCENVTLKVSEKCTDYTKAFYYCTNLTNLIFVNGSVIAGIMDFTQSTKLTKASITSIINALSATASGKHIVLAKTAVNNAFTTEEWTTLAGTKPNWTFYLV